ncbi:uncharacterized protein LOC108052244 [Drosophila rhopaloa]|uniref:Uncharacterized protein n=1 Tax=Drosophila rhopaloa TaxID=1041015 RepID=A0ABM5I4R8_DRORH|nr:uncharacterized protein LOC108052244 [Drosophila rhopaloa]
MKKFLVAFLAVLLVTVAQAGLLAKIFHRESPSTSTTSTTTTTTEEPRQSLFINNNVPAIGEGCEAHFTCKKKLTQVPVPRPCLKYCLKRIDCPNNQKTLGRPNQCVELDEQQVLAALEASKVPPVAGQPVTEVNMMEVAMIDFPCQPGYLPDHRGRCREIW